MEKTNGVTLEQGNITLNVVIDDENLFIQEELLVEIKDDEKRKETEHILESHEHITGENLPDGNVKLTQEICLPLRMLREVLRHLHSDNNGKFYFEAAEKGNEH